MTNYEYMSHIKKIIIHESEIQDKLQEAGKYINSLYTGKPLILVSILKGSFIFMSDLVRNISVPCQISFMQAKSYYESTQSSGIVKITMDLDRDIAGCDVVLVEDIIDTGRTLKDVVKLLEAREPNSLHVITLLDKPGRRIVDMKSDYSLFIIPDLFVVGYGLDYNEYYRELPFIAEYVEEVVEDDIDEKISK